MRYSHAFIPTLKEAPANAQVASHVLMVRGGYIRRLAAGIYSFLPLGWRVLHKIQSILREELNRGGAQEVLMPALIPAELWQESGRWEQYGPELLRSKDRKGANFCFGPTHEEVIVEMVRRDTASYRDLPQKLYQIQSKFRDELRPRAGLLRGREFMMKDAYSFDVSEKAANHSYHTMCTTYQRIFARSGLDFRIVEADSGTIGGSRSHEFQALVKSGEDTLITCNHCDYAANVEQAEIAPVKEPGICGHGTLERVATPHVKTIDDAAAFLQVEPTQTIKSLVYTADGEPLMVLVRGDRSVNEVALKKLSGAKELFLTHKEQVKKIIGATPGSVGPIGVDIPVYADRELEGASGIIAGANEEGYHVKNIDMARDIQISEFASLRVAQAGDPCPRCTTGQFNILRGVEVGHVFFLGTKYSDPMDCTFLDEKGNQTPMVMGCYGIGITRMASAAIEQNHDDAGIIWPMSIAPFEVTILPLQMQDKEVVAAAEELYIGLREAGVDVLLDDRKERPGGKFKDADLIGVPLRITVGTRSLKNGMLEYKWRKEQNTVQIARASATACLSELVAKEKARLLRMAAGSGAQ